ncbi:histone-like transcription factor [Rhodotorula toruloides]|uniref:Histone-like transcription factor n=1 Tax=Rhodotorula toruloides TaxID=5286 RepID=A0A511KPA3_RHOTO|nr:histone-like transcription factor [Rhodotorula toruloides]
MARKQNQARFPLARIKKIIQADEDVGKVAQATPIVVSKAIELFLASLVESCVKDAEERGSKKLTPYGLKRTVTNNAMFDFCSDIVESIPDPLEGEDEEGGKKKRKKAPAEERGAAKKKGKKAAPQDEDDEEEARETDEEDKPAARGIKFDDDEYEE